MGTHSSMDILINDFKKCHLVNVFSFNETLRRSVISVRSTFFLDLANSLILGPLPSYGLERYTEHIQHKGIAFFLFHALEVGDE